MPYRYKKKRAQYMQEYRRFKKRQLIGVKKALGEGRFDMAKNILENKPSISIVERKSKRKRETKQ